MLAVSRAPLLLAIVAAMALIMAPAILTADTDKICDIADNEDASTPCKDCECGCSPPPASECGGVAPASGSKEYTGQYKCLSSPSDTCTPERDDQTCATRIGWALADCADDPMNTEICDVFVSTDINCD